MKKIILAILFIGCAQVPDIINITEVTEVIEPPVETVIPEAPLNVIAEPGDNQITVSWDSVAGAKSYNLYYSTTSGVHDIVVQNANGPYSHSAVNGTSYYYVITAVNSAGESIESIEASATAGIIDNMNGTVTVMTDGLTWAKCSQTNSAGGNAYNQSNNDCTFGTPAMLQYCALDNFECDDGYKLIGGQSEVYNTCMMMSLAGGGWRVPTANELHALHNVYIDNKSLWPGLVSDYHWSTDSYMQSPHYAHVAVNINSDGITTPAIVSQLKRYVLCVKS